jgi:hypothetical protein
MKTKLLAWTTGAALLVAMPYAGSAQGVGLQLGDTADPGMAGQVEITLGSVIGERARASFYGMRAAYSVFDELKTFMDLGVVNITGSALDLGGQVGALARVPTTDFICDVGLRGAVYFANTDNQDVVGGSLMALFSDESLLDKLYLYLGAGADYSRRQWERPASSSTELNPALCAGAQFRLTDSIAFFAELSQVDSFFWGMGIRVR